MHANKICLQQDVGLMKDTGIDAFRFSISWPRILPCKTLPFYICSIWIYIDNLISYQYFSADGTISRGINQEGVEYYNNFTNELLSKGMCIYIYISRDPNI